MKNDDTTDQLDLVDYIERKVTATVEEAMALLEKHKGNYIDIGRHYAKAQIRACGRSSTRMVYLAMKADGLIPKGKFKLHWLPSVFRKKNMFKPLSRDEKGIGHDKLMTIWTFADGYNGDED